MRKVNGVYHTKKRGRKRERACVLRGEPSSKGGEKLETKSFIVSRVR